ncbi:MAG: protein-export chaperone SecB, partial [Methylotenera sp.]
MAQEENNATQEQAQQPGFSIEKIYVKDASLEIPNAPQIFTDRTQPQVGIELSTRAQVL